MKFMVIETFKAGKKTLVYERFQQRGRMLPEGLTYITSWLEVDGDRCFQIMECDDAKRIAAWMPQWSDLVDFEIVPIEDPPTLNARNAEDSNVLT